MVSAIFLTRIVVPLYVMGLGFAGIARAEGINEADGREVRLKTYYEYLKDITADYTDASAVEEELARAELEHYYPSERYVIARGIEYFTADNGLTGELDLVVMDRSTQKVVLVAELKKRYGKGARRKADEQHTRFRDHLNAGTITSMKPRSDWEASIPLTAFDSNWDSVLIGLRHSRRGTPRFPPHIVRAYPLRKYEIVNGVTYHSDQMGMSGELVIIRDRMSKEIVAIGKEFRKDDSNSQEEWRGEAKRLRKFIRRGVKFDVRDSRGNKISTRVFASHLNIVMWVPRQKIVIEKDTSRFHDWTLDLFRHEVRTLREDLIKFQKRVLKIGSDANRETREKALLARAASLHISRLSFPDHCFRAFLVRPAG